MSSTITPTTHEALDRVPRQLFIGGAFIDSASGATFPVIDPSTGRVLMEVAEGDAADVDRAVAAAREAFEHGPWPRMTPSERGRIVWRIADLMEQHGEELAILETLDVGKPISASRTADVPMSVDYFRYMAGMATKITGETVDLSLPGDWHGYTLREPIGVVGQIIPWNFPLLMAAWKIAPALITGNTIVLKPAEDTPISALRMASLIAEAGVPDGVVNIVTGFGHTAGAAIAAHPGVDKVAFTGSTEVARSIVTAATGNLKRVSLELGGKSPNIIFDDADLTAAIPTAVDALFYNAGQACTAGSRLYVQRGIYDEVVNGVAARLRDLKLGPGMDPDTEMGPVVSQRQLDRVMGYVDAGSTAGATALTGGQRREGDGYFIEPTLLVDVRADMTVVREEIFGPVLVAQAFDDIDEVTALANDSELGLAAGVWTTNLGTAHRMARALQAGAIFVNSYNVSDPALPFGGYKQSGWGREHARDAIELYTQHKSVAIAL